MSGGAERERWQLLQELFAEAAGLSGEARQRFLAERCGSDGELCAEVLALLAAAETPGALDELALRLPSVMAVLEDTPPARAGPYLIEEEAGRGGMGVVYRGFDPRLQRRVAIKVVARELVSDPTIRQRFVNEARLASALDHPNICTIHDIGTLPDGRTFLAMAYHGRGTLEERIAAGPLPVSEAAGIARQLAEALGAAHAAGIVHRDVKPRNVAFGERGEVRLLDFGVAQLGHGGDSAGSTAGTPAYMAPEQVRGERVDERADVWALGVVLYEMLAGRRPFEGERSDVVRAITSADPPHLADLRPETPPALAAVVARAMRRDPQERFASMAELDAAIAEATTEPRSAGRAVRRPPRLAQRAATVLLLVGAAGAAAFLTLPGRLHVRGSAAAEASDGAVDLAELGRLAYQAGIDELTAAITLLQQAVERDPEAPHARTFLARAYARGALMPVLPGVSWLDSAETHLSRAAELGADAADVASVRGQLARARGQRDDAVAHYHRALAANPDHVHSLVELGEMLEEVQQIDESARLRERALVIDPTLGDARVFLLILYRTWGLLEPSRRVIREGLSVKPHDRRLLWEAMQIELIHGDTTVARDYLELFATLSSPFEADRLRGWYAYLRGDMAAALPYIERFAPAATLSFDVRMCGIVFTVMGDTARGHPLLRRALAADDTALAAPGVPALRQRVGLAFARAALGDHDEAVRLLREWEGAGGVRDWAMIDREAGWLRVRDDPRFREIVARNDSAFRDRRQRFVEALRSGPG